MNAQDYFDDCTADLGDAVDAFQQAIAFEGDKPTHNQATLIRLAWDHMKSKYNLWSDALNEVAR